MKDKDPNEDEFNQDEQDNINEADDSFGLPDLEFNPLNEDEPDAEKADEAESEQVVEESEPAAEDIEEESIAEQETEETVEAQEIEDGESVFSDAGDSDEATEEEQETASATKYVPPKPESNAPRIIIALVVTIILSGAIWYFMFYRPQAVAEEKAKQEQLAKEAEAARVAKEKKLEEERLAAEQQANEQADADEQANKEAEFITISEPTGRYYIVIASFLDEDMAADLGKEMKEKGVSTALLAPKGGKKFNRLTTEENYGSFVEAQEQANKLKGEYGEGLWVLKY